MTRELSLREFASKVAQEAQVEKWPAWKRRFLFTYPDESLESTPVMKLDKVTVEELRAEILVLKQQLETSQLKIQELQKICEESTQTWVWETTFKEGSKIPVYSHLRRKEGAQEIVAVMDPAFSKNEPTTLDWYEDHWYATSTPEAWGSSMVEVVEALRSSGIVRSMDVVIFEEPFCAYAENKTP